MSRYDNNIRDLRGSNKKYEQQSDMQKHNKGNQDKRSHEPLKYGKSSQSPMAENVGDINLHKGAGDDTEIQSGHQSEPVRPKNRRAADINGVEWDGNE